MLEGKTALVLGGSRGIGAAIVRKLAGEGATVRFTYAGSKDAAEALAQDVGGVAVQADSADREQTRQAVQEAGPLDILVVNAGVFAMGDPAELDPDVVDRMIDINVRSPYHAVAASARDFRADGRIVIIGSVNGDRIPVPGGAAYAMTKSAMQGLVRGFARDFGARAITVNAIQPGPVDTDMNPASGEFAGVLKDFMAIKRYAKPDEVAELAAFLAGPKAGMITGSLVTIDGGFAA
jgi:cyclic-di-GMP-binding biofilm dispersal mediator protein